MSIIEIFGSILDNPVSSIESCGLISCTDGLIKRHASDGVKSVSVQGFSSWMIRAINLFFLVSSSMCAV